jgi:hypothetical protein
MRALKSPLSTAISRAAIAAKHIEATHLRRLELLLLLRRPRVGAPVCTVSARAGEVGIIRRLRGNATLVPSGRRRVPGSGRVTAEGIVRHLESEQRREDAAARGSRFEKFEKKLAQLFPRLDISKCSPQRNGPSSPPHSPACLSAPQSTSLAPRADAVLSARWRNRHTLLRPTRLRRSFPSTTTQAPRHHPPSPEPLRPPMDEILKLASAPAAHTRLPVAVASWLGLDGRPTGLDKRCENHVPPRRAAPLRTLTPPSPRFLLFVAAVHPSARR